VEGETGSCSETDVKCDVGGIEEFNIEVEDALDIKEEVSVKVQDAIDIKDETPEAIVFAPIKTEQEVRLCGVCELVAAPGFRPFIVPKENFEITPNCFLLCVLVCIPYSFKIWIAMGKDFSKS